MTQNFQSNIYFRCPSCLVADMMAVEVPEFDFDVEQMSDLVSEGIIEIQCLHCEAEFEADVFCDSGSCTFTLRTPEAQVFHGDTPMYSEEVDEFWVDPPGEPYQIFCNTIAGMRNIIKIDMPNAGDPEILNRMIFSQVVTALESFLSDKAKLKLFSDHTCQIKLTESDKNLREIKVGLADILRSKGIVESKLKSFINSILWHNLPRVRSIYKAMFSVDIEDCATDWGNLQKNIDLRHDCVHRNGRDHEGNYDTAFTREFVEEFIDKVENFVFEIEKSIAFKAADTGFEFHWRPGDDLDGPEF